MMPIGVPKVAYRVPGSASADWVDIYNRLYRERIIFLGQEIDDEYANQIIGVLLVSGGSSRRWWSGVQEDHHVPCLVEHFLVY